MTTDADLLLDEIEKIPDSDTLRLVYADFLEEDGYSARAELIRLGVELVRMPNEPYCKWGTELARREQALLWEYEAEFRRGPKCERCHGKGWKFVKDDWRPGMMIRQPGDECQVCHGTGYLGGLMRITGYDKYNEEHGAPRKKNEYLHKVEFVRGFPRVHCRMEECVWAAGSRPYATPTDWLLSVVRHHRGIEVWVTDREPHHSTMNLGKYLWFADDDNSARNSCDIHGFLFDAMPGNPIPSSRPNRAHKEFDTKELAQVALARVIPAWARGYIQ